MGVARTVGDGAAWGRFRRGHGGECDMYHGTHHMALGTLAAVRDSRGKRAEAVVTVRHHGLRAGLLSDQGALSARPGYLRSSRITPAVTRPTTTAATPYASRCARTTGRKRSTA
ncbi:hypothetical protein GCM10018790_77140 [Kitasatospora xanthocidica]|nr:hypothetical protein GCM10018790_77140 [Kitasatospora xanthocidica]